MIFNHRAQFKEVSDKVVGGISDYFPIVGPKHTLEAENIRIEEKGDPAARSDYVDQLDARLREKDWSVPIKADLKLVDSRTGRIVDRKANSTIANLPKTTPRFSYIVGGREYQPDSVWRRRPGVFAHIKENGEMESQFHLKGRSFHLNFDPASKRFLMNYGGSNVPLYPIMKSAGVSDAQLQKAWGKEIYAVNAAEDPGKALRKFYKAATGKTGSEREGANAVVNMLNATELDPVIADLTLGKKYKKVDGEVLANASNKLLKMSRGEVAPDPREAIMFKSLHGLGDDLESRLSSNKFRLTKKIKNNLERRDRIKDILTSTLFTDEIRGTFTTKNAITTDPTQLNPLDMIEGATRTTILGPGGISSERQVTLATRAVDPSHLGFLDPMATPEGSRVGIVSHVPAMATKRGTTPTTTLYNIKTGVREQVDPITFYKSNVVMPDEVDWEKREPKPKKALVSVAGKGNQFTKMPFSKADYAMVGSQNMFDVATNMVPFLQNVDNARVNMAVRHMVQAVGLKDPEAPLVMSRAGRYKGKDTPWDSVAGFNVNTMALEDGKITKITEDHIYVKGKNGKTRKYGLYNNFPLNTDGAFLHSNPLVKVGDRVEKDKVLANTNFTRDTSEGGENVLTLGRNLRVGFLPVPGRTFEDAILVSDSASRKLSSDHLYRHEIGKSPSIMTAKNKYAAYYPTNFKRSQLDKLDEEGVAKVGTTVEPGDPIMLAIAKRPETTERRMLARLHKSLVRPYEDRATISEYDVPAEVVRVHRDPRKISVFLKTVEPAKPGDKISGKHGNKGVIGSIVSENEMPRDRDGNPLEVVINPMSVGGRMNPGQLYELGLGKVAEKTGKPYVLPNFEHDDYNDFIQNEMKKAGVKEKEELFDAKTDRSLGEVTVGPMHLIKQRHMTEKKLSIRGGGPGAPYDIDRLPLRGGRESAQALGELDQYALLASGNKAFLRETHTLRSDQEQAQELWRAIQSGQPLPPPKVPFAYKKFETYLQGMGVNLDKEGNNFRLIPALDKDIKAQSNGVIRNASMIRAKDLKEEKGGLFDKELTGGLDGDKFTHYRLPEELPNPVMEKALVSVAGVTVKQMNDVIAGKQGVSDKGTLVAAEEGKTGGAGIKALLDNIDVTSEIKELENKIPRLSVQLRDKANKRLRYLRTLKQTGLNPSDAYMLKNVPIIPPAFRPINVLPTGDLRPADLNELYRGLILSGDALKKSIERLPSQEVNKLRAGLYNELGNVMGIGQPKQRLQTGELRGILHTIAGDAPKMGAFQNKLVSRRLDLSGRSVITPDVDLNMDEIGISKRIATGIYKPFIIRELTRLGYSPLQAQDLVKENSSLAEAALKKVMAERPVFTKRDPVLHKYGVMALKPRLVKGNAIRIHPLITEPLNADFDGDQMAVFAPITAEAVKEAWQMLPSKHLFSPATGQIVFAPTNESLLGLYKMSKMGDKTKLKYTDPKAAMRDVDSGKIKPTDVISVNGINTTGGRLLIHNSLPKAARDPKIITDPKFVLTNETVRNVLQSVGNKAPGEYANAARNLLDLGNNEVYKNAHTLSIEDFKTDKDARNKAFAAMAEKAKGKKLTTSLLTELMAEAEGLMKKEHSAKMKKKPNNLFVMHQAGVKPKWAQYKQMILAPGLMEELPGKVVPYPVTKSFGEGLDTTGYWIKSYGARKGMIDKSLEVTEPGALTKRMVNTVMDTLVVSNDCGTREGERMAITHPDVVDRFAAEGVSDIGLRHGQIVTPSIVSKAKNKGLSTIKVRSPHKCEEGEGICARCAGLSESGKPQPVGTNIGILAGQSIGERGTQLVMRSFHTSGVLGGGGATVSAMNRVQDLLYLPKIMRNSATLSTVEGKVTGMEKDPAGGHNVFVNGIKHYVPAHLGALEGVVKGSKVSKGALISRGVLNPHKLLPIVGMEKTRNAIADELDGIYSNEGIRRRNIEVVTRAVTNLAEVKDPGDSPNLIVGDVARASKINAENRGLKKPVKIEAILKGIEQIPHDQTEDWIARLNHTRIKDTIRDTVTKGYVSKLHSLHPIPSLVRGHEFGLGDGIKY